MIRVSTRVPPRARRSGFRPGRRLRRLETVRLDLPVVDAANELVIECAHDRRGGNGRLEREFDERDGRIGVRERWVRRRGRFPVRETAAVSGRRTPRRNRSGCERSTGVSSERPPSTVHGRSPPRRLGP
ncbi:hypothetical protein D8S78_02840 [Natrialba swarupiae]|nr:hypothetical protein [Natrialba swarupiae]